MNFAAHGDPNGAGLPEWEKFDAASSHAMVFDASSSSRPLPGLAGIRAAEAFLACFVLPEGERDRAR